MKSRLLGNSIAVLKTIAGASAPLPLKELAGRCGLNSSSLSRIVADLAEAGLIEKHGYYAAVAAPGLVALGERAKRHLPLTEPLARILPDQLRNIGVDGAFGAVAEGELVMLFCSAFPGGKLFRTSEHIPLWRSNIAVVVLAMTRSWETTEELVRDSLAADASSPRGKAELRRFSDCFHEAAEKGYLVRREPGRRWSVTSPVEICGAVYGLSLFGTVTSKVNLDRMLLECSRLGSRLREMQSSCR